MYICKYILYIYNISVYLCMVFKIKNKYSAFLATVFLSHPITFEFFLLNFIHNCSQ